MRLFAGKAAKRQSGVFLMEDHAGNADVHIWGFRLRAMLPLLCYAMRFPHTLPGWRLALMSWSGEAFFFFN